jgi:hypothetical protein
VDGVTAGSDCLHCGAALPVGTNYCAECGSSNPFGVVDPLGVERETNYCAECGSPSPFGVLGPLGVEREFVAGEPPLRSRSRSGWVTWLVVLVGVAALGWSLTRGGDSNTEDSFDPQVAEDGPEAVDSAASPTTTGFDSSASPTTTGFDSSASPTSTPVTEQRFVNDVAGPVLGADVHGGLVLLGLATMRRVDLSTGALEMIHLDHPLFYREGDGSVVIGGELVSVGPLPSEFDSVSDTSDAISVLVVTDLMTGSQRQVPIDVKLFESRVVGAAGPDAVWLATNPGLNGVLALEVDLKDGEVRRRIELPREFWVHWAGGNELFLDSVDGSWRYDASTDDVTRLAGTFVSDRSPLLITVSCESSLECRVDVDLEDGLTPTHESLADSVTDGSVFVAPDLTHVLVHHYDSNEFEYFDLSSGTRLELGEIGIDPGAGVVWVPDSPWVVGVANPRLGGRVWLIAVNAQTAEQLEFDTGYRSIIGSILVLGPPA